jgi:hypothetical protein
LSSLKKNDDTVELVLDGEGEVTIVEKFEEFEDWLHFQRTHDNLGLSSMSGQLGG